MKSKVRELRNLRRKIGPGALADQIIKAKLEKMNFEDLIDFPITGS